MHMPSAFLLPLTPTIRHEYLCLCLSVCGEFGWVIWESESVFQMKWFFSLLFIHLYKEESSSAGELSNVGSSHTCGLGNLTSLLSPFIV